MADFTPSKKDTSDFNNGNKYRNEVDDVQADTINNLIESALYTQEKSETAVVSASKAESLTVNQPNVTNAGNVGTPNVEIEDLGDNQYRFNFSNLKGEKGDPGDYTLTPIKVTYDPTTGEITANEDIYATARPSYGRYTYVELHFSESENYYNLPFAGCTASPNHGEDDGSYYDIEYNDGTHKVVISTCDDDHRNSVTYTNIKSNTVTFFVGDDGLMHYKVL